MWSSYHIWWYIHNICIHIVIQVSWYETLHLTTNINIHPNLITRDSNVKASNFRLISLHARIQSRSSKSFMSSWIFRQTSTRLLQAHISMHSLRIFLELQRWVRHPFVQPHEVISLHDWIGAVGVACHPGASIPFQWHAEDQDMVRVLGSRHLLDSVLAWCGTLLHPRLLG